MATNILMPALSPTMTEGTLARWLKKEGETGQGRRRDRRDRDRQGDDGGRGGRRGRARPDPGRRRHRGREGERSRSRCWSSAGEAVPAAAPPAAEAPAAARQPRQPARPAARAGAAPRRRGRRHAPQAAAPRSRGASGNGHDAAGERIFVSPLARRMAQQAGIDLAALKGSGPNGRIVKADIEAAQQRRRRRRSGSRCRPPRQRRSRPRRHPRWHRGRRRRSRSPRRTRWCRTRTIRKVIARRLTEAKQTIPHFYVSMDIEIDALLKLREELNAKSPKEGAGRVPAVGERPGHQGRGDRRCAACRR